MVHKRKQIPICLDLDNTLISSVTEPLSKSDAERCMELDMCPMDDDYYIYARPGLQEFLDELFSEFKVSVFTAASKNYAAHIIDNFILTKPNRNLQYVFFVNHCNDSKTKFKGNNKHMSMLWHYYDLGEDYKKCILVDDLVDWSKGQEDSVINIKPFEVTDENSENDCELAKVLKQIRSKTKSRSSSKARKLTEEMKHSRDLKKCDLTALISS